MQNSQVIELIRGTRSWDESACQYERKMELRERDHLLKKSKERQLTPWEIERLSEIGKRVITRVKIYVSEQSQFSEAA
jgi:hypothetical protein